jgi:PAS domain S-box-containing protein
MIPHAASDPLHGASDPLPAPREPPHPQARERRAVTWIGAAIIGAIVAMAVYDIVRGYRMAIDETARQLEIQARIIAEQTARGMQAVDVVLRHLDEQFRQGMFDGMNEAELHAYLREQAVGLEQVAGLMVIAPSGYPRALSIAYPMPEGTPSVAGRPTFEKIRANRDIGLVIDPAVKSDVYKLWVFPIARRLETPGGEFAGVVAATGRIDYFQNFYRDVQLDPFTKTTLMHLGGTLLARYPPVEDAIGKHYPLFDQMLEAATTGKSSPLRTVSPVDGVERFGALQRVQGYPLAAIVTRDVEAALGPWRREAIGTAVRTLGLGALAALLLWLLRREIGRLQSTRRSLEVSQERYALAVAGSEDGIWDFDFDKRQVFGSARAREIVGVPPHPETQSMDSWFAELPIHPEDAPKRIASMEAHLEGRAPAYHGEFRIRHPDGSYRWVLFHGLCIRDATGRPYRMAGSVSDIDDKKRAEEALRESEERFAIAVAGSYDGIWDWKFVTGEVYNSPRGREILGLAAGPDVQSMADWSAAIESRIHPDDRAVRTANIAAHLAGETPAYEGEFRVRSNDGGYRWVRVRGMCVRNANGEPLRMAGSASDIDAQKRAQQALRESEERYQLAVAGANQGLWDWDLATDIMFVSPRAQQFIGLVPGEPLRPRREWIALARYHPDDIEAERSAIRDHLRGRTPHFAVEVRLRQPSGEWHWVRQRGVALRDANGRAYRMAGSMEDINEYKLEEARRLRLEGELLQAKKLEAIGTLAGGIAHDFNNILSAILGYGEMAQKAAAEGTSLRRHVDAVVSAGMRAKSLVERILAFSRSGIGERTAVHVQAVVVEALDLFAASLPAHVKLERRLDAGDATVMGDPTQIHQVLLNLCTNGAQAMRAAGTLTVTLDVVDAGSFVAATSALASGRYVRLAVRDTGVGIPESVQERIFDPFFTTKDVGVGTGLGLSLVHGIVTDLGGGIDVDSKPGAGTTFTVYLPWSDARAATAIADEAVPSGNGETILLVDDEEPLVRLSEEVLASLGYEPIGFTSSAAALKAFRAAPGRFDAVLSDESMPEMTGTELIRALRQVRNDIPIVLMSGFVSPALQARARQLGVAEVIPKPLVAHDIARSLAAALASSAMRQTAGAAGQ